MSEPFLAEIRMVGFNFAPRGWALCDGQILPINQNQALYSLLGTTYGGDGRTTFALPDLRGRVPIHADDSHPQGQRGGEEAHVLSAAEMPAHRHSLRGSSGDATQVSPAGGTFAGTAGAGTPEAPFYAGSPGAAFASGSISNAGGGQSHDNMQPFLAVNFAIALQGLFPSRN
jgi:microcystin-dependent protein